MNDPAAVRRWISATQQRNREQAYVATFVVDEMERLWIADQRSEHVACARGGAVFAAGEISFAEENNRLVVSAITNQSTGYCPEPACWPVVQRVLERIGLAHPDCWTTSYEFRRCAGCGAINLIKDGWFECGVCELPLSQKWNFEG